MNVLETILNNQRIAIIDGAMATELEARGCDLNDDLFTLRIIPAVIARWQKVAQEFQM